MPEVTYTDPFDPQKIYDDLQKDYERINQENENIVNYQAQLDNPNLTAEQYFALPDLVTAEKILKTLKQI